MKFISNRDMALGVYDIDSASAFYGEVLGFKTNREEKGLRVYETGNFMLYVEESVPYPPVPSLTVENLAEAKKYLLENGCEIINELEKSFYFRDPFGVVWDIIEA